MKRALAERAKQSSMSNGIGSMDHSGPSKNTPTAKQPLARKSLQKMPKAALADNVSSSRSAIANGSSSSSRSRSSPVPTRTKSSTSPSRSTSNATSRTSSRGTKRQRETSAPSIANLESEDDDDTDRSAFYLRQQNRALGSELRQIKYQLRRLERERDHRRNQCYQACQSIGALQTTWAQMETLLSKDPATASTSLSLSTPTLSSPSSSSTPMQTASQNDADGAMNTDTPMSTGEGPSVEMVGALLSSISELGEAPQPAGDANGGANGRGRKNNRGDGDDDDDFDSLSDSDQVASASQLSSNAFAMPEMDAMLRTSDNIAQRAGLLQKWIWAVLCRVNEANGVNGAVSMEDTHVTKLSTQVSKIKAKYKRQKQQLEELSRTRDALKESDKRVRRGLYRLASKRDPLAEILKDIERTDNDKQLAAKWMAEDAARNMLPGASSIADSAISPDGTVSSASPDAPTSASSTAMEKQLANLEEISKSRQELIDKMLEEKRERELKLNELTLKLSQGEKSKGSDIGDKDKEKLVRESKVFIQQTADLTAAKQDIEEMKSALQKLRKICSEVMANEELVSKSVEEIMGKHEKKWSELAGSYEVDDDENNNDNGTVAADGSSGSGVAQMETDGNGTGAAVSANAKRRPNPGSIQLAERVVVLEHKLTQVLENVRQAETTRQLLSEAIAMNDSLQNKIDEVKTKYSVLQQAAKESKAASSNAAASGTPNGAGASAAESSNESGSSTPKQKSLSSSALPPAEKLYKDNKKLQRDVEKYRAARDSLRAKYERAEKEREGMFQTNAKLLKQTAEKDEMNAKSLSTILHLKQVTEKLSAERINLEHQAKNANQIALAARLADNARVRVMEEFHKAKNAMHASVSGWEAKCSAIRAEKNAIESKMLKQHSIMSSHAADLAASKERCDELATEMTKLEREKQEITELLSIAQTEAADARKNAPSSSGPSSGSSTNAGGFTVDQLNTQVSVLKGRLTCPVCNHRDKKCILLRCRHMFCRECVDINIKNRSRKCPACGIRFDTKDVADVWL